MKRPWQPRRARCPEMSDAPATHPFLLRLAHRLLARAERSGGMGSARLKLDRREAPELHTQVEADEIQRHVLLIEELCEAGWTVLRLAPPREFAGLADRNPQLELLDFDALAEWSGYTRHSQRWQAQWLRHLEERWLGPDTGCAPPQARALLAYLARNPLLSLQDLPLHGAADCLEALHAICAAGRKLSLREASARVFQGRSKVLDHREELLHLLGAAPGQFQEVPLQLMVDAVPVFDNALFIENLVTFESMADRRQPAWASSLLVYAAGFKGSARRLRHREGSRPYFRESGASATAIQAVTDWLFGPSQLPVFFFGDLDYAGMQILCSLRSTFPAATAWRPGYERLALLLESGGGHAPEQAAKELQADPGRTGCEWSDARLLPLMRMHGRFVDQEAFSAWDS